MTLEEFQSKAYNDAIKDYTFVCELDGVTTTDSPKFTSKKAGITLHFLRYGLFSKDSDKVYKEIKVKQKNSGNEKQINTSKESDQKEGDDVIFENIESTLEEVEVKATGLPTIEGYSYAPTNLREGYIYILDESDPDNKGLELQVDALGTIKPIIWKKGCTKEGNDGYYDIRLAEGKGVDVIVEQDSVLWIAFSTVQWPIAYHKTMRADTEKRKARMTKVTCSGFVKGDENPYDDAFPYDELTAVFTQDQREEPQWLRHMLRQMKADDRRDKKQEELKDDMFIVLDDPISCADDIARDLKTEFTRLQALILSMKTGIDDQLIFKRMLKGEEFKDITEEQHQISFLFTMAQTSYQLVYNDEKMIDEYDGGEIGFWNWETKGNGVSKDKLLKILGVNERKEQRSIIGKYREAYGTFLQSQYYLHYWTEFADNINCRILDGKAKILEQLQLLALHPHATDKHLDLKAHDETIDDKWQDFLINICVGKDENAIRKLLDAKVDLGIALEEAESFMDRNKAVDIANKAGGVLHGILETFGKAAFDKAFRDVTQKVYKTVNKEIEVIIEMIFTRCRSLTVYGDEVFEVKRAELNAQARAYGDGFQVDRKKVKYGKYRFGRHAEFVRMIITDQIVLKKRYNGKSSVDVPIKKIVKEVVEDGSVVVKEEYIKVNERALKAQNIFKSAAFQGAIGTLNMFNLSVCLKDWQKDDSWKNRASLAAASTEIVSTVLYFTHSRALILGASEDLAGRIYTGADILGRVSLGFTSVQCLLDALDSYKASDHDAMLAWTGAGVCFGYLAIAGTSLAPVAVGATAAVGAAALAPPLVIVGGIGVALVITARYLTDTPLQTFFKNFPLSDAEDIDGTNTGIKPWKYNNEVYQKRATLVNHRNYKWQFWRPTEYGKRQDFKVAYQDLLNTIVCSDITWKQKGGLKNIIRTRNVAYEADISAFTLLVSFRELLYDEEQFEYEAFYFPNGVGLSVPTKIAGTTPPTLTKDKRGIPAAEVSFNVPEQFLGKKNRNGEILFVCRFQIYDKEYFPYSFDGKTRWLGAKFDAYIKTTRIETNAGGKKDNNIQSNLLSRSNVRIDELENLKRNEDWRTLDNY